MYRLKLSAASGQAAVESIHDALGDVIIGFVWSLGWYFPLIQ